MAIPRVSDSAGMGESHACVFFKSITDNSDTLPRVKNLCSMS